MSTKISEPFFNMTARTGRAYAATLGVFLILMLAMPPWHVLAQETFGTILGTVIDTSGAAVPGVRVTVTNLDTAARKIFDTDTTGNYFVSYLIPGTYSVSAEKEGFKKLTKSGIVVAIDQKARVDLALEVGAITESVTVTAQAPLLQTSSSEVGQVITGKQIVELPLQIRDFAQLISLIPGAYPTASTTGGQFTNPDNQMGISANVVNGFYAYA